MKALVIDDSRTMRTIIGRIVKELGYDVVEAGNGKEGLTQLQAAGPFEIALVDWNMPEMNGYEFVVATRADAQYAEMKIMMVTTETEVSQVTKAIEAGANEYLMKPFTKESLKEKLESFGLNLI